MSIKESLLEKVSGTPSFNPTTVNTFGDWSIEAGDVIMVGGQKVPAFSADMDWNGAARTYLSCFGNQERKSQKKEDRESYSAGSYGFSGLNSLREETEELFDSFGVSLGNVSAALETYVKETDETLLAITETYAVAADVEAALKLKAEKTTVEELDSAVKTIQTAQADLTTRVKDAESAISLKASSESVTALDGRVTTVEEAQTSLASRVGGAEASLKLKADSTTVTALDGRVTTVESSVATLKADVINLQGEVEILGNLSITEGRLNVSKSIYTDNAVFARTFYADASEVHIGNNTVNISTPVSFASGGMSFGGNTYTPQTITSTTGDVTALGKL